VVDGVMEDIRLGMEVNLPKYSQRRVAMIKYLGELYNYRMVESSDIFKVTSLFLAFIDEFVYWYHRFCLNVFVAGLE
jgi:regulator of nonsense transcripts 2